MVDIKQTVKNLNEKGFIAKSFETMDEAKQEILSLIDKDKSVGTGGSMTLKDSGVLADLREKGCEVYSNMLDKAANPKEYNEIGIKAMHADYFMTSTNALTENGSLVNIDGKGNRVAAMSYGKNDVIVLCGTNKVVGTYGQAIKRIKTEACGKNARRIGKNTPCSRTDLCDNCTPEEGRICNITSIIEYPMAKRNYYVFIVNGEWGY